MEADGRVGAPRRLLNCLRRGVSLSRLAPLLGRARRAATAHDSRRNGQSGWHSDGPSHSERRRIRAAELRIAAHPGDVDPGTLRLLPATAAALRGDDLERFGWGWMGTLRALLAGTRDAGSSLAALREHEATVLREIYSYVGSQWAERVKLTLPAALVGRSVWPTCVWVGPMRFDYGRGGGYPPDWAKRTLIEDANTTSSGFDGGFVAFARCGRVEFPTPACRSATMMPFVLGDRDSLPCHLQCYFPLTEQCPYAREDEGKVAYLTVHESDACVGEAEGSEGLRVECPGTFRDDATASSFTPGSENHGENGTWLGPDKYEGGIFMASSVVDTCEVWNALVDSGASGVVDRHGGCEHLRGLVGRGTKLGAGELVWMTDCTPHEILHQKKSEYRQFFKVVMPCISHWYADHSTANPLVPLPSDIMVVRGNMFVQSLS